MAATNGHDYFPVFKYPWSGRDAVTILLPSSASHPTADHAARSVIPGYLACAGQLLQVTVNRPPPNSGGANDFATVLPPANKATTSAAFARAVGLPAGIFPLRLGLCNPLCLRLQHDLAFELGKGSMAARSRQ